MFAISQIVNPLVRARTLLVIAGVGSLGAAAFIPDPPTRYVRHNLVSDIPGLADVTDPNLRNAWGIVPNPNPVTGVWWVNDNHAGLSTLYDQHGAINSLVVSVPDFNNIAASGAPTGIVFHDPTDGDFVINDGAAGHSGPAVFMFASEDGTITGWNPAVPPEGPSKHAQIAVNDADEGAIYKGLALAHTPDGNRLYTTDFHNNRIEVYDGHFDDAIITGDFQDDQLPDGFAPFGIAAINGKIFVSFAKQDADAVDDVAGKHLGVVDVFDTNGNLLQRLISGGKLNAPWGMVQAPADFGRFSGDLLVGNFGDGRINVYDINTGEFQGTLGSPGQPFEIEGLWGLAFGNGGPAGPKNVLFFSAGPGDEEHGLFGSITAVEQAHGRGNDQGQDENDD